MLQNCLPIRASLTSLQQAPAAATHSKGGLILQTVKMMAIIDKYAVCAQFPPLQIVLFTSSKSCSLFCRCYIHMYMYVFFFLTYYYYCFVFCLLYGFIFSLLSSTTFKTSDLSPLPQRLGMCVQNL